MIINNPIKSESGEDLIRIIVGQPQICSNHRIETLTDGYHSSTIITRYNMESSLKEMSRIEQPVIFDNILFIVREQDAITRNNFINTIKKLEDYPNSHYINLVWIIKEIIGGTKNILTSKNFEIINLRETHREDYKRMILNDIKDHSLEHKHDLTEDLSIFYAKAISQKLNFSVNNYHIYKSLLFNGEKITQGRIEKTISSETYISLISVLEDLLLGANLNSRYKRYKQLCDKYSYSWVHKEMIKSLEQIIKAKNKVYITKQYTVTSLKERDWTKQYNKIITGSLIGDCIDLLYLLRLEPKIAIIIYLEGNGLIRKRRVED